MNFSAQVIRQEITEHRMGSSDVENFQDHLKAAEARADATSVTVADAGVTTLNHVVALASAMICALALKFALQVHLGLSPLTAVAVAAATFVALALLHFVLHPRPSRVAPAHKAEKRRHRSTPAETQPEAAAEPVAPVQVEPPRHAEQPAQPNPAYVDPQPAQHTPAVNGFEHLQSLVAELARMTPGPKAATPDPDGVQAETAAAWAQFAAARTAQASAQASVAAQAATLRDVSRTMTMPAPADDIPGYTAELTDALAADRMTVYLEPIQQIEFERPRHYEVSVRFKDAYGDELPHQQILAAARSAGLLPRVDAAVLPAAARIAQHFQSRGRDTEILSRVHGESLPDQQFRAEVTAATIAADGAALVLSFEQSDLRTFGPIHWEILSTIADMGLRFAIESVTDLDMDFDALRQRGFSFVKLDASVLLEGLPAAGAIIASGDVCRHFAASGLALIVNHIDDEQALARILGFGVLFGQGALFGTRRAVRSDILTAPIAA